MAPTSTSVSTSAPKSAPKPVEPKATTGRTSRYVPPRGVMPAVIRSQATRQNQTPALIGNQGNSSNASVAIAEYFRPDTTSHVHKLGFFSFEAHDIVHEMDSGARFLPGTPMPRPIYRNAACEGEKKNEPQTSSSMR